MEPEVMTAQPKRKRKWFWVGILMCFIAPPLPGLVCGVALLTDKETRRDGLIVTAWALIWFAIVYFGITWLVAHTPPSVTLLPLPQ